MLLSDEEIEGLMRGRSTLDFGKAVQSAILAKLASAELPEPVGAYESIGSTAFVEGFPVQMLDICDAYSADQLRQAYAQGAASLLSAEPEYYVYRVNGLRWNSSAGKPHEDDYDEGTLIELYTRKEASK